MQKKKGISLIVLVITIIVMIILAAAVVISLSNTGVIDRASQAVDLTNEAQVQDLAALVWADAYLDNKRGDALVEYVEEKLRGNGIILSDWEITISDTGILIKAKDPLLNAKGTVPNGATYTKSDGIVINEGGAFPSVVSNGDRYACAVSKYDDYTYTYEEASGGWTVAVIDKTKEAYDKILESINGKPITSLKNTFDGCESLVIAPEIPTTVTNMFAVFRKCTQLTDASNVVVPSGVTNMYSAFHDCKALIKAPDMSNANRVTNLYYAFSGCSSLTDAPMISKSVTNMNSTFKGCKKLTGTIIINADPTTYTTCFGNVDFSAQNIALTGESTILDTLGATGTNYCATCNGKCKGGH